LDPEALTLVPETTVFKYSRYLKMRWRRGGPQQQGKSDQPQGIRLSHRGYLQTCTLSRPGKASHATINPQILVRRL